MSDLATWIERWAGFAPEKAALVCDGETITYGDLAGRIARTAAGLARTLGIGRGDRVAFLGENCPEALVMLFACARLGAIHVPLNWRLAIPEQLTILNHCGARAMVTEPRFAEVAAAAREAIPDLTLLSTDALDGLAGGEPLARAAGVNEDSAALLVYTAGTTGRAKGALLSQGALLWNAVNSTHLHDLTSADVVLTTIPMFHVGGLNIQTLPALHAGATVHIHRRFDVAATFAALADDRPTLLVLVPAQMRALLDDPGWATADLSSLRMLTTGSTIVPHALIEAFHARGVPVGQVYGTTETAPIATGLRADQAFDHVGSAGLPALHCEIRLVDEGGGDVGAGARGEVWVRGPNVMREYWRDAEASEAALADGWFRTGDVGERDEGGFLTIVDRKTDVIISGGENVYPAEVERFLAAAPAIAEAAVVGRADARWGEVPVAVVVRADPGLEEAGVLALLKDRLARYKQPRAVIFVEALPRNAMGKVEKPALRELVAARTGC